MAHLYHQLATQYKPKRHVKSKKFAKSKDPKPIQPPISPHIDSLNNINCIVNLSGFHTAEVKNWQKFRSSCYNDLKNYNIYICKFDFTKFSSNATVYCKTEEQANLLLEKQYLSLSNQKILATKSMGNFGGNLLGLTPNAINSKSISTSSCKSSLLNLDNSSHNKILSLAPACIYDSGVYVTQRMNSAGGNDSSAYQSATHTPNHVVDKQELYSCPKKLSQSNEFKKSMRKLKLFSEKQQLEYQSTSSTQNKDLLDNLSNSINEQLTQILNPSNFNAPTTNRQTYTNSNFANSNFTSNCSTNSSQNLDYFTGYQQNQQVTSGQQVSNNFVSQTQQNSNFVEPYPVNNNINNVSIQNSNILFSQNLQNSGSGFQNMQFADTIINQLNLPSLPNMFGNYSSLVLTAIRKDVLYIFPCFIQKQHWQKLKIRSKVKSYHYI